MVATVGRCYTDPKDYAQDNYYNSGDCFANSEWLGEAATAQNLSGQIQEQHFLNAYRALDPNGNSLRRRQNYSRNCKRENRPGTDVTLSAPKSISVAALVFQEREILEAHRKAVRSTMEYVEKNCIYYQAKQKGQKLLPRSYTAQIAIFHHDDNRNKDPQLHSHCVILNQTLCPDGKWRAVANHELYVQQKTIGAYYAHELARGLKQRSWNIEWTDDHTFELAGVDKDLLDDLFSTRSNKIEAELAALGLTRADATAELKQTICLKTRPEKKQNHRPEDRERQLSRWQFKAKEAGIQIDKNYAEHLESMDHEPSTAVSPLSLLEIAAEILTERQPSFYRHELLKECLRQSQGGHDPVGIQIEIESYTDLVPTGDGRLTTRQQLDREREIIEIAESGRNSLSPLATRERVIEIALSLDLDSARAAALAHMATSPDAVILVQSRADEDKTFTIRAFKRILDSRPVRGLALSADADVLQNESRIPGQTLASYLVTPDSRLPGDEILLVDEAETLSTHLMARLFKKAGGKCDRIILMGDLEKSLAVEAGAPFKLLQERVLPISSPARSSGQPDVHLKRVVTLMTDHERDESSVTRAYQALYNRGKIQIIADDLERVAKIADDYLSREGKVRERTLILADTDTERQAIVSAIRPRLIESGALGGESITIQTLRRKDIENIAIALPHQYQRGDIIKFTIENARFNKDCFYRVSDVNRENNALTLIDTLGTDYTLPLDKYKQREVYRVQQIEIRRGEWMHFTKNIRTEEHQQLEGQRFSVEALTEDGRIIIQTKGKTLTVPPERLLHCDYRYVDTIRSGRGQTADYCIYCASKAKKPTICRESFYLAASRAKLDFVVYTANSRDLGVTVQVERADDNGLDLISPAASKKEKDNRETLSVLPRPITTENPRTHPTSEAKPEATRLSEFSDAELIDRFITVQRWKNSCPPVPSLDEGHNIEKRINGLHQQKAIKETQLKKKRQKLQELRAIVLFNTFGAKAEVIRERQEEVSILEKEIHDIARQLDTEGTNLETWKQKMSAYRSWSDDPKTEEMGRLAERLESPDVQKQLARIREGYTIYKAARLILELERTRSQGARVFQRAPYRIEERENTLTIFYGDSRRELFVAIDRRGAGGIVEINRFDLTRDDSDLIQRYARSLEIEVETRHQVNKKPKKQLEL